MNYKTLLSIVIVLVLFSCNNDVDCTDTTVSITSLEMEYGCTNTKYQMDIEISDTYMIIRDQSEFIKLVSGDCQPTIDFTTYDVVMGKKKTC